MWNLGCLLFPLREAFIRYLLMLMIPIIREKHIPVLGISEPIRRFRTCKIYLNNQDLFIIVVTVLGSRVLLLYKAYITYPCPKFECLKFLCFDHLLFNASMILSKPITNEKNPEISEHPHLLLYNVFD